MAQIKLSKKRYEKQYRLGKGWEDVEKIVNALQKLTSHDTDRTIGLFSVYLLNDTIFATDGRKIVSVNVRKDYGKLAFPNNEFYKIFYPTNKSENRPIEPEWNYPDFKSLFIEESKIFDKYKGQSKVYKGKVGIDYILNQVPENVFDFTHTFDNVFLTYENFYFNPLFVVQTLLSLKQIGVNEVLIYVHYPMMRIYFENPYKGKAIIMQAFTTEDSRLGDLYINLNLPLTELTETKPEPKSLPPASLPPAISPKPKPELKSNPKSIKTKQKEQEKPNLKTKPSKTNSMKPNLKQANARIKAIMQEKGITFKEAQKEYWQNYKNNIGVKVAKLRTQKQKEAEKNRRTAERQSKQEFKRKCHTVTGNTDDGYRFKMQLTDPRKKRRSSAKKATTTQPGQATN